MCLNTLFYHYLVPTSFTRNKATFSLNDDQSLPFSSLWQDTKHGEMNLMTASAGRDGSWQWIFLLSP